MMIVADTNAEVTGYAIYNKEGNSLLLSTIIKVNVDANLNAMISISFSAVQQLVPKQLNLWVAPL